MNTVYKHTHTHTDTVKDAAQHSGGSTELGQDTYNTSIYKTALQFIISWRKRYYNE